MTMRLNYLALFAALLAPAALAQNPPTASAWPQMEESDRRQALLNARIQELSLQRQLQQLEVEVEHGGQNEMPVLVGITLGRSGPEAEFVLTHGLQRAAAGEPLGGGWTVREIGRRSVELVHVRDGRARHYHAVIGSAPSRVGGH